MTSKTGTIGVIGGMGPLATIEFMSRVVRRTPASDDCDHLRMLVDNDPKVPSRIERLLESRGEDPLPYLLRMARGLESAGADFLVMPCNTAHHYHAALAKSVSIPFPSVIDIAATRLDACLPQRRHVGMLASPATRRVGVFESVFAANGLVTVYPDADAETTLLRVIRSVKEGSAGAGETQAYHAVAHAIASKVDVLLIACSELSVMPPPSDERVTTFDTLDLLAEVTISAAKSDARSRNPHPPHRTLMDGLIL